MTHPNPEEIEIHDQAKELARELVKDFSISLVTRGKLIAFERKAEMVLRSDVESALRELKRRRSENPIRQVVAAFGGALFGAGIQGFVAELTLTPVNALKVSIYAAMAFGGMLMVLIGIFGNARD